MISSSFFQQKPNEKIVFLLRRNWFTFFKVIAFHVLLALIPLVLYFIFKEDFTKLLKGALLGPVLKLGVSVYYLSIWLFFFANFVDYYLDVWIVTTKRIINIEQKGLFARTVSELKLYSIQDVTSEIQGIIPTLLHFGNIYVQTAAETERFVFKNIDNPPIIAKRIIDLSEKARIERG